MRTADFDFLLPENLIAQHPTSARDESRLLVLDRSTSQISHRRFHDLPSLLKPGDLLVMNDSRVIPARLRGRNPATGGAFEILLLEENSTNDWWCMMRPAKRARIGAEIEVLDMCGQPSEWRASVRETNSEGHRRLAFAGSTNLLDALDGLGEMPLPPYIRRPPRNDSAEDRDRYQTVYAGEKGSVAAPTAGLHFTPSLFSELKSRGIESCRITLHVGPGTFAPVKTENVEEHVMHYERYHISDSVAQTINNAKADGRRVVAVGTTSVRTLESVARKNEGRIVSGAGRTNIFIRPPSEFQIVDALITNFHLPQSTLLMLVSALAAPGETRGRELMLHTYRQAIAEKYRFFSYGDAMLIV